MTKEELQYMVEASGFIPSRFGRAFGYEASNAAIERLVERIVKDCAFAIRTDSEKFPQSDVTWIAAMQESAMVVIRRFGVKL